MKSQLIAVDSERSSAYGRRFLEGIAHYAETKTNWELVLVEAANLTPQQAKSYDGWICRTASDQAINVIRRCGVPTVDALCKHPDIGFAQVRSHAEALGTLASEHFMAHGYTHAAFCGYRRVLFSDRRRNAFARALEARNIRPFIYRPPYAPQQRTSERLLIGDCVQAPPDMQALSVWLARLPKPVAVFCCDDIRASHVIAICKELKFAVPRDVAVLGVDNDPVYCLFSRPKISSIDPNCSRIGFEAAGLLDNMLQGNLSCEVPHVLDIPPKGIVARMSTDMFPGAPAWFSDALTHIHREAVHGLTATDLFAFVGFSRTLVERTFKSFLHKNVKQFIIETRMAEALRLLGSTNLPVKEIARQSGFSSAEYFVNAFTSLNGMSPGKWRTNAE